MPRTPDLPRYAFPLLVEVMDLTGYPVALLAEEGIGYDSELRMGRKSRPVHEVAFVPSFREHALHFLVSGLQKILRFYQAPPEERLVPATDVRRGLPKEVLADLKARNPGIPPDLLQGLDQMLYRGAVRQVTSMPLDIRVEHELAEQLPEHRPCQQAYLRRQVLDLLPHFSPEIAACSPADLYRATSAMNLVLMEEAIELLGREPPEPLKTSPYSPLSRRLRERLRSALLPGYPGDRRVIDDWARELGVREWYEWVPMASTS